MIDIFIREFPVTQRRERISGATLWVGNMHELIFCQGENFGISPIAIGVFVVAFMA
jgi:hypothetical protein